MEPMLPPGSLALFRARKSVVQGDVVLVEHPEFGTIVKRVREVQAHHSIALEGTSPASTSPERLGSVALKSVKGVLLKRLR